MLDFDQPVGLLLIAILHAIPDDSNPYGIVRQLMDELAPGSHLAVSHATADSLPDVWDKLVKKSIEWGYPLSLRSRPEVERLFTGLELVEPGIVWVSQWRPEHDDDIGEEPERSSVYVAVGRKP
jgi:S-adenosyl methyltransferase